MLGLTTLFIGGGAGRDVIANPSALPAITLQPLDVTVEEGDVAMFQVKAANGPNAYQWRKGGVNLAGETRNVLEVWSCDDGDEGEYDCVVTNLVGSTASNAADLVVTVVVPTPAGYWGLESVVG